VTIGVYTFELHLPGVGSLKGKRQIVKRLKDRLRSRHNVAIAEYGEHADRWQRAGLALVSVAQGREPLERLFETVHREARLHVPGEVIETGREFIEGADGGERGWSEDWS